MAEAPGLDKLAEHTQMPEDVFSTKDALEVASDDRPLPDEIWGGLSLVPGQLMELIGPSGIGKSRIALALAIAQVLGREFAGMPTLQRPLHWLFYGNENSFYRFREDVQKLTINLTPTERERMKGRIFLPMVDRPADMFVSFTDQKNLEKLRATIVQRAADVVVFDPWGGIIAGDELNDSDVRRTLSDINQMLTSVPDRPVVGIILNHSRNGMREMARAAGFEQANYGKNSKAIYTVVRCVWNLRPGDLFGPGDPVTKIELIHAKSSDRKPYPPVAIEFKETQDKKGFRYARDTTFNHDTWQCALEKLERLNSNTPTETRAKAQKIEEDERSAKIMEYVTENGPVYKHELDTWVRQKGWPTRSTQYVISGLVNDGKLAELTEHLSSKKLIGIPEAILKCTRDAPVGTYR